MTEVGHYGLHWLPGDIAVLLQGKTPQTAIGLDVEVKFAGKGRCNHAIDLSQEADLPDLTDPLVTAFLPLPRQGAVPFIDEPPLSLVTLGRMSSPIRSIFLPLWSLTPFQLQTELHLTNVQPLVLTDIGPQHRQQLDRALTLAATAPRPVIMVGSRFVPNRPRMQRITTDKPIDPSLNWEAIGATVLRRHMLDQR